MEFWGREVKPGSTVSCEAGAGSFIHLSQAALAETKKGSENVVVFVKVGDRKLAIGTLSADKHPQIMWDLVFGEAFELSHNSKTTSVFFCGYKVVKPDMFKADSGEEEDEELETDEIPVKNNETAAAKIPAKDDTKDKQDDDSSDDTETSSGTDESDDSEDDSSSEDGMSSGSDDSKDEETPMQPEVDKKRTDATALKTPASDKKAKMSTPKKDIGDDSSDDTETSSGTDESDDSEDDSSNEDGMSNGSDDSSGDDSKDEETPMQPEVGKKRTAATALKTPASDKKAKMSTPKKDTGDKKSVHVDTPHPAKKGNKTPACSFISGDQKSVHVDTPHPAKKASKTPADGRWKEKAPKTPAQNKAKEKSPKSGSHSCKSCSKTFNSAVALESHQKAKKHEA